MNPIGPLLRAARENAKITVDEISKELESKEIRASKKTIYSWENGNSQPTPYAFLYMCKRYGIKNPTVYFGYDSSATSTNSITQPPHYSELRPTYRAIVDATSTEAFQQQIREEQAAAAQTGIVPDNVIPLRLSEQAFSAGRGVYLGPEAFDEIQVERNPLTEQATYAGPVEGDSMEPKYHDGDILLIDASEYPEQGDAGIFSLDGCGYVKKLGNGKLISLNTKYDPIQMDDSIRCNGKVIGVLDPAWIVNK